MFIFPIPVSAALASTKIVGLKSRFDLVELHHMDFYPCRDSSDAALAMELFEPLRQFYAEAANQSHSMLSWID